MEITEIFRKAYEEKASDVHFMPGCPVMARIDGTLREFSEENVQESDMEELFLCLRTKSQRKKLETAEEIGGVIMTSEQFRLHFNLYRQQGIYAAAVRILASEIPDPLKLHIPESVINLTREPKGLILITGAAGSGKTTTIASLLKDLAAKETKSIVTMEDPVEYLIPRGKSIISQREIGRDTRGYAQAVRSSMRQDPDVLYIGEMQDRATRLAAIIAAETGRLVISSLHTDRIEDTLHRLLVLFGNERKQEIQRRLANVLKGIVTKQLLLAYHGKEQKAVYEVMLAVPEIRKLISEGRFDQITSVMEQGKELGMQTMDQALLSAYMKSEISAQTAIAAASDTEKMQQKMRIY